MLHSPLFAHKSIMIQCGCTQSHVAIFPIGPTCDEGISCQYVAKQCHLLGNHLHIWASCGWSAHDLQFIVLFCRGQ